MPCHVPATSVSSRRRLPSLRLSPPRIVAALDLQNPSERAAHDLLRRFTTGRWPLWRLLGLRRDDGLLLAALEWVRSHAPARFAVCYPAPPLSLSKQLSCGLGDGSAEQCHQRCAEPSAGCLM